MVLPATEERRVDLARWLINEFFGVHDSEQGVLLLFTEPPVRAGPLLGWAGFVGWLRLDGSVIGGPLQAYRITRAIHRDLFVALLDEFDSRVSSLSSCRTRAAPGDPADGHAIASSRRIADHGGA